MPEISVNGETIHYERAGQGPTLAMLHSLGTNSYLWKEQIERWQDKFTCVAFDARGHGRSTNNGGATAHTHGRSTSRTSRSSTTLRPSTNNTSINRRIARSTRSIGSSTACACSSRLRIDQTCRMSMTPIW